MSLVYRSVTSVFWNVVANGISLVVRLGRAIILARVLPIDTFGVYSFASAIVNLTGSIATFGLQSAFLHRSHEVEDEAIAASNHFSLQIILTAFWAIILVGGALVFTGEEIRTAMIVLVVTHSGLQLTTTPRFILFRRVKHRRLALLQFVSVFVASFVAVTLAWYGVTLWALLSIDITSLALTIVILYIWRPVWRPQLAWSSRVVKYFLRFGAKSMLGVLLFNTLDRLDDLWTGIFLGKTALGYYSRAYTFATYPSQILANPINVVAGGTYAELKGDRKRLSLAFIRVNKFLIITGFGLAGFLVMVASEMINFVLGEKWLPMVVPFQLMLIFTLLNPLKSTIAGLFVAVGEPEKVIYARAVQLAVLFLGLFSLGLWLNIVGVAIAVDLMLVVGIFLMLQYAHKHIDFSLAELFIVPSVGLLVGIGLGYIISKSLNSFQHSDWFVSLLRGIGFIMGYSIILVGFDFRTIKDLLLLLRTNSLLSRK